MDYLEETIKKNKPNIAQSTIKTYKSILKNLFNKHHDKDAKFDLKWFNNQDEVINCLKDNEPSNRKTTISAILSIVPNNNEKYRQLIMKDIQTTNDKLLTQNKSETQKENWIDYSEVQTLYNKYYEKCKPLFKRKREDLDKHELSNMTDYLVLALTCGFWFPPRRNQDWILMKIRNFNDKTDNFLDVENKQFVFNIYKTSKFYETQRVDIPKKFFKMLKRYIEISDSDYLIVNAKNEPYSTQRMTQKMNMLFDGKISTSMLRHIYLTDKLKDIPKLTELTQLAENMGHSVKQQLEYIKK